MKKTRLPLLLLTLLPMSCSAPVDDGKYHILCTTFPIYDWIRNIIGETDEVKVDLLMKNGSDPHSYQPSIADVAAVVSADCFVYGGGESDNWVEDIVDQAPSSLTTLSLFDILGEARLLKVTSVTGSDTVHDEYDEHVWLSPLRAKIIVEELSTFFATEIDINEKYAVSYLNRLEKLDSEYKAIRSAAETEKLVIADRFALRYLADDYDFTCFAAFDSCNAETEASFATIKYLADRIDEHDLNTVLILENSSDRVAKTVIRATDTQDQSILTFNSLQAVTASKIAEGLSYLETMESNGRVIKEATSQ